MSKNKTSYKRPTKKQFKEMDKKREAEALQKKRTEAKMTLINNLGRLRETLRYNRVIKANATRYMYLSNNNYEEVQDLAEEILQLINLLEEFL